MSLVSVILLAVTSVSLATQQDQVAAPTSNWASVYSSDTTDYREPVRDQVYPLVKDVSRSDWFNSYPYHKFEERREEKKEESGILENVAKAVGSVRQKITDFGDDVVNSALGLVGAEKTDDGYQERDGPQAIQAKYPHERDAQSDGNTVRPAFVQPDSVSPIEQFRLGVRSYLDPIVDPMVDPIKRFFKADQEPQHERKQNIFPSPIAAMSDFGKRVAGGFSTLSRLSSPSKVSSVLFPWLTESTESTEATEATEPLLARSQSEILAEESSQHSQYLPLLPPVFIPPVLAPAQQAALPTHTHHHHQHSVPAPRHPLDVLGLVKRPPHPPSSQAWPSKQENERATVVVNPPRTQYSISQLSDRQPLKLLITPIVNAALRQKQRQKDSESESRNVMYYLPPPDLSSGLPQIYDQIFNEEINEIESSGVINYLETEPDLKDTEDVGQTTTINLSPESSNLETLIVDISQDLPQIYYETSDDSYNDVVDTEDNLDAGVMITDSTESISTVSAEEAGEEEIEREETTMESI